MLLYDYSFLREEDIAFTASALNSVILDKSQSYFQIAAAEIVGVTEKIYDKGRREGRYICARLIKAVELRSLIDKMIDWISAPITPLSIPAAHVAKNVFVKIFSVDPKILMASLGTRLNGGTSEKIAVFRVLTLLMYKRVSEFNEFLSWVVENAVKMLDPNFPHREPLFPFVTSLLQDCVKL